MWASSAASGNARPPLSLCSAYNGLCRLLSQHSAFEQVMLCTQYIAYPHTSSVGITAVQSLSSNSCLGQLCLHAATQQNAAYNTRTLCMSWSPGIQTSGQLMILMLVLQDVGLDAATASRLGLRREDV